MKTLKNIKNIEHTLELQVEQIENTIETKVRRWTSGRLAWMSTFAAVLALAIGFLVSANYSKLSTTDDDGAVAATGRWTIPATNLATAPTSQPILKDGIPVTIDRNVPVGEMGISMNPEVVLTAAQASVVRAFNAYLTANGESAVVTSGKRTSEGQLQIIKDRIVERGADGKFPRLEEATVADTKIWLKAWQWLRHRRVPVNAPAPAPGARTSMHLKGLAIDFISDNLDHLRGMLASFAKSKYAREADLRITGIVREPGCVHINLG